MADPKQREEAPPGPPALMPAPSPPPPSLLPGGTGESPVQQAARVVKSAEDWAQQIEKKGTALTNRLGSGNSPTNKERQAFLDEETKWRSAVKYGMDRFRENSREEAANGLAELLDRFGPKLAEIRIHLGGN